jgi:hypothetical protein
MADSDLLGFEETVGKLKRSCRLEGPVMWVLAGRIVLAHELDDLTLTQTEDLLDSIEPGFHRKYNDILELAAIGDLLSDAAPALEAVA